VLVAERPWGFDSLRPHSMDYVNPTTDPQRLPQANWRIDWVLWAQSMRHSPRPTSSMP
jgi:hypothetical protein